VSEQLVTRINDVRFTPVRLREGYEMDGVDTLLDELVDAVTMGRAVGPLVQAARFTPVRLREGYDMAEVDRFLAGVVAEADGTAPTPASDQASSPGQQATAPSAMTSGVPSVIEERPSMLDRLLRRKR
jgi:DivIVA domain-containing protein